MCVSMQEYQFNSNSLDGFQQLFIKIRRKQDKKQQCGSITVFQNKL